MTVETITDTAAAPEQSSDAAKSPKQLLRWSEWLHVGPGAAECPLAVVVDADDFKFGAIVPECTDASHFHAFCRLPNQLQHADIREHALAAKARRMRALRDPSTPGGEVLDFELDELRRAGEEDKVALVDELMRVDWWQRQLDALREVAEREEFEHIDADRMRLEQLQAMSEDARPLEEYEQLLKEQAAYHEAVKARVAEMEAPKREALTNLDVDALVGLVRDERIKEEGNAAFNDTYSRWEWFAGTLKPCTGRPSERMFASLEEISEIDPEVMQALGRTFRGMERQLERGAAGNS